MLLVTRLLLQIFILHVMYDVRERISIYLNIYLEENSIRPSTLRQYSMEGGLFMIVRLGYVAIALGLPKVTSSSNVTYTNYMKLDSEDKRITKLKEVTYSNLLALKKILQYNIENNIHFYRVTSALVPLATHPDVNWDYRKNYKTDFRIIGDLVKKYNIRIDTHPDQFNVINSIDDRVVRNTMNNLWFHANLFEDLVYPSGKMVLHVGSSTGGKEESLERFKRNFRTYPLDIRSKIILENDDKTFTAKETLKLCKDINVPMVLDVHHHNCNNDGEDIKELIDDIFKTWKDEEMPPKLHFSSPKEGLYDRKHSDFIDGMQFVQFIESLRELNIDIDIMLEAKMKDLALFDLAKSIKSFRKEWIWIDDSTFQL